MDKKIDNKTLRREAMRRYIKWGIALGVVSVAVATALLSITKRVDARDLTVGTVIEGPLSSTIAASGRVVPAYEEIINSPVDSRIVAVYAQAGDTVEAGMPLLELDLEAARTAYDQKLDQRRIRDNNNVCEDLNSSTALSELAMQIKVKEMEVARQAVEVDNERRLDSLGSGTGDRVRQAETSLATGRLELEQLRTRLANERKSRAAASHTRSLELSVMDKDLEMMRRTLAEGQIPAPHSGVVTYISNEIGSRVAAGEKVAVVSDLSQFKIQGEVPEGSGDRVAIGSEVIVRIGTQNLGGRVTNISPSSNQNMVSFGVALDDPRNNRLRPGLSIDLQIVYGYKDKVILIPNGNFFKGPGAYNIFVFDDDDHLIRREVELGDSNREYIEVKKGLKPGDRVVTSDMSSHARDKELKIKK
jgi:HlyD family secretion protein